MASRSGRICASSWKEFLGTFGGLCGCLSGLSESRCGFTWEPPSVSLVDFRGSQQCLFRSWCLIENQTELAPRGLQEGAKRPQKISTSEMPRQLARGHFLDPLGAVLGPSWPCSDGLRKRRTESQDGSKRAPRGLQEGPRMPQEGPKRAPRGPQETPKNVHERDAAASRSRTLSGPSWSRFGALLGSSDGPTKGPKGTEDGSQRALRELQAPRGLE